MIVTPVHDLQGNKRVKHVLAVFQAARDYRWHSLPPLETLPVAHGPGWHAGLGRDRAETAPRNDHHCGGACRPRGTANSGRLDVLGGEDGSKNRPRTL
jgi:hypothetical protein